VLGPGLVAMFARTNLNRYGQVINVGYLEQVLRKNKVAESSKVGPGNARHINQTIELSQGTLASPASIAALDYIMVFHESIHAVEEDQGETGGSGNWAERNAYWMEFHASRWAPRLRQIETTVQQGNIQLARRQFALFETQYQAGAPDMNPEYPNPDPTGMAILRAAGFSFDTRQAAREIERLTGRQFVP
jgi:hypothetical protein